jgi:G3E family GTPase
MVGDNQSQCDSFAVLFTPAHGIRTAWIAAQDEVECLPSGILNLRGEAAPVVIHGVHHVFHPPVALREWPDTDRRSRIVFITRGIAREEVLALWQAGRAAA